DWSYSPPHPVVARDSYEAKILKDRLNLPSNYYENGNFPSVPRHAHDVLASNLDDSKSNGIIKKFLKILVLEIGEQNFDDAASKFCFTFIEWQHVLWMRINKLFEDLQRRVKNDEIDKIFAAMTVRDVQKVWQQFLININIPAICEDSTIANNFKKLLSDVVHTQAIFFNLNNDLYTINLNVLTLSSWNVASSIDLSHYNFMAQRGPEAIE
ncbi:22545_t:CDS:2, partial [Cetraspora pellucida]